MLQENGVEGSVSKPRDRLNNDVLPRDPDEAKLETKHTGKYQTIIVEVYETEEFQRKIGNGG